MARMLVAVPVFLCAGIVGVSAVQPDGTVDPLGSAARGLNSCRTIEAPADRLDCYDVLAGRATVPDETGSIAPAAAEVALGDLKQNLSRYAETDVETRGVLVVLGNYGMLGETALDGQPLTVDLASLPAADQRAILRCGGGCSAAISGRIGPVLLRTGIVARSVIPE